MNIWTGLLFLEGAVSDPRLAQRLAGAPENAADGEVPGTGRDPRTAGSHEAEATHACGTVALCPSPGIALR